MRPAAPLLPFVVSLLPATAWTGGFACQGTAPAWTLTLDTPQARFEFPAPTDMDVMNDIAAEGADWPRALTLIGERDTAIVLLEQEACGGAPFRAHILTQRGQTPILLTGCCTALE
ncbi:MAG: hypothetical protein QNJ44_12505 [Rhodobacter sp.]|nr:hypothetical protein [Rhodobacter sp.]